MNTAQKSLLNHANQQQLFPTDAARPVTLIGIGSIGSHVANVLVRLGVTDLTVYDPKSVSSDNVPYSLYGIEDIGHFKVAALARILLRDTGVSITTHQKKYAGEERLKNTVIACVDHMSERQKIWPHVRKNPFVDVFVDTRISKKMMNVFLIRPHSESDVVFYERFLSYGDHEAAQQFCGEHGVVSTSYGLAGITGEYLAKFWQAGIITRFMECIHGGQLFFTREEGADDEQE